MGDRGAEVVVKLIVEEKGCRLRSREHAGPSLVSFDSSPLYSVVVGICAKDADVIDVLVAVGWWWVLVCAELVASTEDAGVQETGLGFIVVTELCRTCSSRTMGYPSHFLGGVGGCVDLVRGVCARDGSKVAVVLV